MNAARAQLLGIGLTTGAALVGLALLARRPRGMRGLAYPPQPCGKSYDDFRAGWTYGNAYEQIAWREGSKGTSQRAVLREMRKLKRAEYERYEDDCAQQAAYEAELEPEPEYGWWPGIIPTFDDAPLPTFDELFEAPDESVCTRRCTRSRPCGRSCIARTYTCTRPTTTACSTDLFSVFDR